jgi:hypothetical protein
LTSPSLSRSLLSLSRVLLLFREKIVDVFLISFGVYLYTGWSGALITFGTISLLYKTMGERGGRKS